MENLFECRKYIHMYIRIEIEYGYKTLLIQILFQLWLCTQAANCVIIEYFILALERSFPNLRKTTVLQRKKHSRVNLQTITHTNTIMLMKNSQESGNEKYRYFDVKYFLPHPSASFRELIINSKLVLAGDCNESLWMYAFLGDSSLRKIFS